MMTNDKIKKVILCRLYSGAFEPDVNYYFNLHDFAKENEIDNDLIWKIFDELKADDLIRFWAMGGMVAPTPSGLLYCEKNNLVDEELMKKQNKIRTKLLVTLAQILEEHSHGYMVDWKELCQEAEVSEQDFHNNEPILRDLYLIEKETHRSYVLTSLGKKKVNEYKKKVGRLESFEKLGALTDMTVQQRGHKLEDLLAEVAEDEEWEVNKRVRSQGQEHDIIMHVGLHYFLISCKWEQKKIQPNEVELLESRVRSRATTNGGIIFSMSGFTKNCIEEARLKLSSALIILYGPSDIRSIFKNEKTLTELLEEKLDQAMHHRKILINSKSK